MIVKMTPLWNETKLEVVLQKSSPLTFQLCFYGTDVSSVPVAVMLRCAQLTLQHRGLLLLSRSLQLQLRQLGRGRGQILRETDLMETQKDGEGGEEVRYQ